MKEFRIIYRILSILRKSLELEEFDKLLISNESLNITIQEWARLINMLVSNGYVEGIMLML
ncbi:MAG: YjcQ family protein [Candidatus Izemoplasmatales bacterium]|nr:YjcQ family protein [Candidatus Izemoplasmatales bacterium]